VPVEYSSSHNFCGSPEGICGDAHQGVWLIFSTHNRMRCGNIVGWVPDWIANVFCIANNIVQGPISLRGLQTAGERPRLTGPRSPRTMYASCWGFRCMGCISEAYSSTSTRGLTHCRAVPYTHIRKHRRAQPGIALRRSRVVATHQNFESYPLCLA